MNLGGGIRFDEEGNAISGKTIDMVVEGENVYIVSVRVAPEFIVLTFFFFLSPSRKAESLSFWNNRARPRLR